MRLPCDPLISMAGTLAPSKSNVNQLAATAALVSIASGCPETFDECCSSYARLRLNAFG